MNAESRNPARRLRPFSAVAWCALIMGTMLAFANYVLVLIPNSNWMRSSELYDVEHDSLTAFGRRFLLGAVGGALIGLWHAVRDSRTRKR